MYNPSLKPVVVGIGIGLLLIAIPFFLIKALFLFLLVGVLFRFVARRIYWSRRMRASYAGYGHRGHDRFGMAWHPAFADTIRNMSEEDYGTFRQKLADEQPVAKANQHTTIEIQ